MIVKTRYRDVPWEEIDKAHPGPCDEAESRRLWNEVRGTEVLIYAKAVDKKCSRWDAPVDQICDGPWYVVVNKDKDLVCPHLAEIGD